MCLPDPPEQALSGRTLNQSSDTSLFSLLRIKIETLILRKASEVFDMACKQGTFNRDIRSVAVGLWGILVLGVWTCIASTQKGHPPKGSPTEITSQVKSDPSPAVGTVIGFPKSESSTGRPSGAVTSIKSPLADQTPTKRTPKESLGWTQIAADSTPSPVLVLSPEISQSNNQLNQSESLLPHQPSFAQTIRRKAYRSQWSARQLRDAETKKRLLELWHRSLARSETHESWAMFSKQDKRKKAASTARKKGSLVLNHN
jgi:hypothetical protein